MANNLDTLKAALEKVLGKRVQSLVEAVGELTLIVKADDYLDVARLLRDEPSLRFEQLLDICGVDYSDYADGAWDGLRFAAVSHLISISDGTTGRSSSGAKTRRRRRQLCVIEIRCDTTAKRRPSQAPSA